MADSEEREEAEPIGLDRSIQKLEDRRASKEGRRVAGELKGQRARGWTEKLLTRTLSGVIYVVVILVCLYFGVLPTALLLSAMGWLCCSEFYRICRMAGRLPNEIVGLSVAIAYPLLAAYHSMRASMLLTCVFVLVTCTWYVFNSRANISDVAVTLFGPLYTSCALSFITLLRASNEGMGGALLALLVIGAIWAEDSFAYLVGSTLGRHKMAPRISPNKSWEGFVGGLLGSIGVWSLGAAFHVAWITWPVALACGLCEGLVSVLGDLFESRLKRSVGVKDSGNLMPGHGGILDRTDSLLFGSVVAYIVLFLGGVL
ncbi:MAG: phosphatidate cytidylyltransferase [Coriobacteriales bacterium]|nr:phosphatidate cytidylyltransferase [Coriobacteriales bacterium]